jgi:poly(3-hydroxyalkanoate) synthetase
MGGTMTAATTTMFARETIKMTTVFATKTDAMSVKIVLAMVVDDTVMVLASR